MIRTVLLVLLLSVAGGCVTSPPKGITPITGLELQRYLGTWYEIARLDHRFERGLSRVTAEYSLNEDGTIKVVNRGYNAQANEWDIAEGTAKFRGDETVGSLKVSFFGPFYGGYHIIDLDDDYQYAMVAGPSRNYLWILARDPNLDETTYQRLVEKAAELDFPAQNLIQVEHGD